MTLGLILLALLNPPPIVVEYLLPRPGAFPHDPAVGRDGVVWYTDQMNSYIGRLDPATGRITEYILPTEAHDPHTLLYHDAKIWFTVQQANLYGVLDPATGSARVFPVPTPRARPYGLVAGVDRAIWMALFGTNK